ncbi:MAG: hypothetical protein IJU65_07830 [Desulfovibrio sp.]|nr:hypothetical protein [Desulfovibrio sp.]
MSNQNVEELIVEYAANKEQADSLTARNSEIAAILAEQAAYKPGSDTGKLTGGGYNVTVTRRINEKWDQDKLETLRKTMSDSIFFTIFKRKYEPDRRTLKTFMNTPSNFGFRPLLMDACTATPGKPSIKLVREEAA